MATQQQTAEQIWKYLTGNGWSKESVAAILGNMQSESGIIADRWESDDIGNISVGYGLVQWTPASKYIDWANTNGLIYQDVISQCKRLEWEVATAQQFYSPDMTFEQFTKSTQSPEFLADVFIRCYERPLNPNQPARQTQARYWYDLLKNVGGTTPPEQTNKGEITMQCIFYKPNATGTGEEIHYFNGVSSVHLPKVDCVKVLKQIYKDNNGKDMPEYHWVAKAPWYNRLDEASVKFK